MKLLNLGCGGDRVVSDEWVNIDDLYWQFPADGPERAALNAEPNFINFLIGSEPLPFEAESFDGILASHFFEHFDAQEAVKIMKDCFRVLKRDGVLLVSVPNASYFRNVYPDDRNENWPRLFDVSDPPNPIPTFFEAALWFEQHKAIFTEDSLWCYLRYAGFHPEPISTELPAQLAERLNRRKFSLEMVGRKVII